MKYTFKCTIPVKIKRLIHVFETEIKDDLLGFPERFNKYHYISHNASRFYVINLRRAEVAFEKR